MTHDVSTMRQPHRRDVLAAGLTALVLGGGGGEALAGPLPNVGIGPSTFTITKDLPVRRPWTPLPPDPDLLFFIQHSQNANTIVYTARRNGAEPLDSRRPVDVFWRQFAEDGRRKELSLFERIFVFGVRARRQRGEDPRFRARLAAYRGAHGTLELDDNRQPRIRAELGTHAVRLVYAYAELANNAFIPKIAFIDVVGVDLETGDYVRQHVKLQM